MRWEISIERMRVRQGRPSVWRLQAKAVLPDMQAVDTWLKAQGAPNAPEPGWAIRIAVLP